MGSGETFVNQDTTPIVYKWRCFAQLSPVNPGHQKRAAAHWFQLICCMCSATCIIAASRL